MEGLPADILADILLRIPGKSLINLKLVCWEWFNLISYLCLPRLSPPSTAASFSGIIFVERNRKLSTVRLWLGTLHEKSNFDISGNAIERLSQCPQPEDIQDCCNGILLLVHHDNNQGGGVHYTVYNPTTGQTIQVPPPHNYHTHSNGTICCFASLAFDPTKSLHYKIISTHGSTITNPLKVEAFSSETGKWSRYVVDIDSKLHGVQWIQRSAYLDGRVYRLVKDNNYLVCIHQGKSSQLFRVQVIGLPNVGLGGDNNDGNNFYGTIGISRRRLLYSTRDRNGSALLVYIWMDDIGWLLQHTISFDDLLTNQSSTLYKRDVIRYRKKAWFNFYFHPNCDRLFLITPYLILVCFPEEKLLKIFHIKGHYKEIVLDQNYSFPYSYCPVMLQNAFQRTSCANLDQHESVATDASCSYDDY